VLRFLVVILTLACGALVSPALAANPIQTENTQAGTTAWYVPQAPPPAVEGYVSELSVLPGQTLRLHVSTEPAARYRVEVYRLGWYGGLGGRLIACAPGCASDELGASRTAPSPDGNGEVAAGWPVTDELLIPADAVSGYYVANLVLTSGPYRGSASTIFFVVRSSRRSPILVQVPVNTWEAYNEWGGKSLYEFNSTGGTPANRVSFDRPIAPKGQWPIVWEVPFVRFLEREGYDVSYQTDVDTHLRPAELLQHRLVMTSGHDEYWSKEMRDAFDSARDQGTNLGFMGANNGYWQIRYEDGARTIVGYKSAADPNPDPALKTVLFRDLVPGRPECQLEGVQHQGGFRHATDADLDYSVNPAALGDAWFANTGLDASSVLHDLVGREWDTVPPIPPAGCSPPTLTVLFRYSGPSGDAAAVRYVAPSGARVFASGSLQFAWGLDTFATEEQGHAFPPDPRVQQFARNVLADLTRPAPVPPAPTIAAGRVQIRFAEPDPRVTTITVFRHTGAAPFLPADPGAVQVCRAPPASPCSEPEPPGHETYLYAAVATDEWADSSPAYAAPLVIPDTPPRVKLTGPLRPRAGAGVAFRAAATDRDGDALSYSWRIDGRSARVRSAVVKARLRVGVHRITVAVADGHGVTTRAGVTVRARR
jgi:hypothetical protein